MKVEEKETVEVKEKVDILVHSFSENNPKSLSYIFLLFALGPRYAFMLSYSET